MTWKGLVLGAYVFSKTGTTLHYHGDIALLNSPKQWKLGDLLAREGKYGPRSLGDDTYFFMSLEAYLVQGTKASVKNY